MSENQGKAGSRLGPEELAAFCLQLSYPIKSGIAPADCIGMLLEETESRREKELLTPVYAKMLEGASLAAALEEACCFPDYMVHALDIAQASGNLEGVLEELVQYYRKEAEMAASFRRAATGPAVMLGVMSILLLVLVVKVLPAFNRVFMQMGGQPSATALALSRIGHVIQAIMPVVGVLLLALAVAVFVVLRGKGAVASISAIGDKLFFRGRLGLALGRARFCSALSMTLSSGMAMDEALAYTQKLLEGSALEAAIAACRKALEAGAPLPAALQEAGIVAGLEAGILKTGYKAGFLDQVIGELALRYQQQADDILDGFVIRVEPGLIILLSVTVGLSLLSVMLPLIGMLSSIGG